MIPDVPPNLQVYIVDDDDVDRAAIARLCDQMGIGCKQYACPLELLDDLDADSTGCVVTDLRMPEMSGLQLHRKIKARGLGIATIIVTGFPSPMFENQVMGSGLFGYCEKSNNSIELKDLLLRALQTASKPQRNTRLRY